MLNFIGTCIKYGLFGFAVLILSNIVEYKGQTLSQHVQTGMNWFAKNIQIEVSNQVTNEIERKKNVVNKISKSTYSPLENIRVRMPSAQSIDSEHSIEDQRELQSLIQRSRRK